LEQHRNLTEQARRKNLICLRSGACSTGNLDRLWCSWSAASVRIFIVEDWKERSIEWIEWFYLLMLPLRHQQIYLVKCVMTRWRACYRSSCCSIETALRGRNRKYCHFKIRSKLDGRFYNEWERAEARSASPAVWYIRFCQYRKVGFERSARCGEDGSSFLFLFNFQTSAQSAIEKTRP
jgi:hypothetical protein